MRVLGVIVHYRTPELCVSAIEAGCAALDRVDGPTHLVVVDNDSRDGSYELLRGVVKARGWGERVSVWSSGRNGGFGFGNNFAIRRALRSFSPPDYFYLQNPDAFPEPGAVAALLRRMEADPRVGIAGSFLHGTDGAPHRTAFRFPTAASELETYARMGPVTRWLRQHVVATPVPDATVPVDWVAGASMLVRREVFERVGTFDEAFFLYFEETDLCLRARQHGYSTLYVRDSVVEHIGSASTGLRNLAVRKPSYWFDSRRHYFQKHHGRPYLWLANAAVVAGTGLCRLRRAVQGHQADDEPRHFLRDFVARSFRSAPDEPVLTEGRSRRTRHTPSPPATPSAA
jgi:N-acetylglucosaminyl-diphospho-decaprenol L-rhamnosyltransferase